MTGEGGTLQSGAPGCWGRTRRPLSTYPHILGLTITRGHQSSTQLTVVQRQDTWQRKDRRKEWLDKRDGGALFVDCVRSQRRWLATRHRSRCTCKSLLLRLRSHPKSCLSSMHCSIHLEGDWLSSCVFIFKIAMSKPQVHCSPSTFLFGHMQGVEFGSIPNLTQVMDVTGRCSWGGPLRLVRTLAFSFTHSIACYWDLLPFGYFAVDEYQGLDFHTAVCPLARLSLQYTSWIRPQLTRVRQCSFGLHCPRILCQTVQFDTWKLNFMNLLFLYLFQLILATLLILMLMLIPCNANFQVMYIVCRSFF